MNLGATYIDDTFAEAFGMRFTRLVVSAHDQLALAAAVQATTGYASSIIACDCEAGLERLLPPGDSPDGRPAAELLFFGFSTEGLAKAVANRTGQCLMTCATTAVFDGLPDAPERLPLGKHLRFFGDGHQQSKLLGDERYWRVPVMDGEFLVANSTGVAKGIGGGNLILQASDLESGLAAARRAVAAVADLAGAICPFPGGFVRSGSKVGSRYHKLKASTNDAFCPTLKGRCPTQLHTQAQCAYEIVIDGVSEAAVAQAMCAAMRASAGPDIVAISAGNYGGTLGKYHFRLREILASNAR